MTRLPLERMASPLPWPAWRVALLVFFIGWSSFHLVFDLRAVVGVLVEWLR